MQAHVFETLPKGEWYVTVVDRNALKVLSSHLKMSDLLEYNVSVVDPLEKRRREAKNVVYLISPVMNSMQRVLDDFQGPKPLYENVRLYFTSKAPDKILQALKSCHPLVRRLTALKEVCLPSFRQAACTFLVTCIILVDISRIDADNVGRQT